MREEGSVDRESRVKHALFLLFFVCCCAADVYLIIHPQWRVVGVIASAFLAFMLARIVVPIFMDDMPQAVRKFVYRGWHGKYRAFEDRRIRVLDGERFHPSRVFAADVFDVLGEKPSATDLAKLEARYGTGFEKGTAAPAEGEWLFSDEACTTYVRGHMDEQRTPRGRNAMKFALWLEREVFMPIDNHRTADTGKTFAFTKETTRR